jgi:WD40 repeat protein
VRPDAIALTPIPDAIRHDRKLDVVFVHGLGENDIDAWQQENEPSTFWPKWLADEFPEIQVWLLRYGAAKFWFKPAALALPDRAKSVLGCLVDNELGRRDLLFIAHSLGGLVVKQLLAISKMGVDPRFDTIATATRGIVFLATPHTGSNLATVASRLGIGSRTVADLQTDDPWLRLLKDWYRNNAPKFGWQTRAFHETQPMFGALVVSISSADPNVADVTVDPVDANHVDICKPRSKEFPVYKRVAAFTRDMVNTARSESVTVARIGATAYITVPPLPENYVERTGVLGVLREAVTADRTSRSMVMIAVQGMGGLGKTILAQALCRDEVVQQAFPDGVAWITVGKEPRDDFAARLREIGKALGDDPGAYDGERAAENRYKSVIHDKAVLIVLDDVWNARDIEPFRAESPRSRLVFTTRDAGIASGTGAQLLTPDFLSPDESRAMLASWSGSSVDAMPPTADVLIRECGGLALAVATIGARLRDKSPALWDVVLNQLRQADLGKLRQQFPDYPYPDVLSALQVSVDALEPKMRERYLALAVMLEDMPIHPLIQRVLWNTDQFNAVETAEEFVRLALAQRDGEDGSIRLHDLLLDYVRAQYPDRAALGLIHGAIRLSSHVIDGDPGQFVPQLVGRLLPYAIPSVQRFTETVIRAAPRPWLLPRKPALQPPGTGLLRTLFDSSAVTAVAVTPDGRRAVSAADDRTLTVWEIESGRELQTLFGGAGGDFVNALSVTPDGRRAVSASRDGKLKMWELESGRELQTLAGHAGWVTGIAVTSDGRRAVSASHDGTLKVWGLESGRELQTFSAHTNRVNAVAVTPDGRRAVSASDDHTLKVWVLESGRELQTLAGHADWVNAVAVTPDGRCAVSASRDRTLKVWELQSGCELQTLAGHADTVNAVAATPDGQRAVSASRDRTLKVWDLESGRELQTLTGHTGRIGAVAVTPDGRRAVSASADHTLKVWELESGRELQTLAGHTDRVGAVAVTPDGRRAVSASDDRTLKVWELESGRELQTLTGHTGWVTGVAVTPDGRRAVSASVDQRLKVWELESGRELQTLAGHTGWISAVAVTPDGRRAVSASDDRKLKVWELESSTPIATFSCDSSTWCCALANDWTIVAGDQAGRIYILAFET